VIPDDVKAVAQAVMSHRIIVGYGLDDSQKGAKALVEKLLDNTPVPTEDFAL